MDWTVCDFRGENISYKEEKIPNSTIYLQKAIGGKFICRGGDIDAIIKIDCENYLVCEIKRLEEGKQANWFTHSGMNNEINDVRDYWKNMLANKPNKSPKDKRSYAWPIVIGGQLEASFSKINDCNLEELKIESEPSIKGNAEKIKNPKRCLIFHKDSEKDVEHAFKLLFDITEIDQVPDIKYFTIANVEDVRIWAFGEPDKKKLKGWYPDPELKIIK